MIRATGFKSNFLFLICEWGSRVYLLHNVAMTITGDVAHKRLHEGYGLQQGMATRTFPVCVEGTHGAIKTQPMVLTVPSLPAELNAAAGLWSPALVMQVQTDPEKKVDKMGDLPTTNAFPTCI